MNRDNIFEQKRREQSADGIAPEVSERIAIEDLSIDLQDYISKYSLGATADLSGAVLTVNRTTDNATLRIEPIEDTYIIYKSVDDGDPQPVGPLTKAELVDEIESWLTEGSIDLPLSFSSTRS